MSTPRPAPPTNKGRKLPPEPLTDDEVGLLLGNASNRSHSGVRMRAMIGVMRCSGLRLAETLDLYPRDLDTQAGIVRVREGKGRKSRTVGIDPQGGALVDRWLDRRRQLGLTARHPIFAQYERGRVGRELDPRYVRAALARLADRAGITKRVHPHGLRHSFAFDLANRGVPTHVIQVLLGHGSLHVTDVYVRHLMPADAIAVVRNITREAPW